MRSIEGFEQLKILGDRQRLAILRRLMVTPATLSQLGDYFHETAAHIRYHLKALEQAGFVEPDSVNLVGNLLEKYYKASAEAYQIQLVVTPEIPAGQTPLMIGSNDAALQRLAAEFAQKSAGVSPVVLSTDSLEGLVKLQEGLCEMATCHLLDPDTSEYNRGYVRHIFAGRAMSLMHLYHREAGLLVRKGNPKQIHGVEDLARSDVRMVNREGGSGMRAWLDAELKRLGIAPDSVKGYQDAAHSHLEAAGAVAAGRADAGVGLHSSARSLGLDFIPLFEEPYDLVLPQETLAKQGLTPFFDYIYSREIQQAVKKIGGYVFSPEFGQVETIA